MTPELTTLITRCPVETVAIASLRETLPVRAKQSEARMMQLADWATGGVSLDPIWITRTTRQVIAGGHRVWVCRYLGEETIQAVMLPEADRETLIDWAVQSNVGGSLELNSADFEQTVSLYLSTGMLQRDVVARMAKATGLTPVVVRTYVRSYSNSKAKAKLVQAARAVINDDMTVAKAAETYDVPVERLRDYLKSVTSIETWQRKIDRAYESFGKSLGNAVIRPLVERVDDGQLSRAYAERCLVLNIERAKRVLRNQEAHLTKFRKCAGDNV